MIGIFDILALDGLAGGAALGAKAGSALFGLAGGILGGRIGAVASNIVGKNCSMLIFFISISPDSNSQQTPIPRVGVEKHGNEAGDPARA